MECKDKKYFYNKTYNGICEQNGSKCEQCEKESVCIIHFEIGTIISEESTETTSVFTSGSLIECLKEWEEKKYARPKYFMDVWENDNPIIEIK